MEILLILSKTNDPNLRRMRWFGSGGIGLCFESTDKHLILCVSLINGLRHRRHEYLEATAEARHNRGQLAGRLYHLRLDEIRRCSHLPLRAVDCMTHELDLITSFDRRFAYQLFQFTPFTLNHCQRL